VKYYLVDVSYSINEEGKLLVHFFSRDENKNYVEHVFPAFPPYCYLTLPAVKQLKDVIIKPGFHSYLGDTLYKIQVNYPKLIKKIRNELKKKGIREREVFEGDIEYKLRYIIDKRIKTGYIIEKKEPIPVDLIIPTRILFIDIEVFSRKISKYTSPVEPIIIIGTFDNYSNRYLIFISKHLTVKRENIVNTLKSKPVEVEILTFDNEREMLIGFSKKLLELNPDLLTSFSKYDLRYLIARMKQIGINTKALNRIGLPYITSRGEVKLKGRGYLDLQFGYRILYGKVVKWESLNAICTRELGYGKLEIPPVYDTWLSNPNLVVLYNLRDVELIKELDRKKGITEYFINLKNIVGCPIEYTYTTNSRSDLLYLRKCYGRYILPNRRVLSSKWNQWSYTGALVLQPKPGVYEYIAVLDFKAQYPNIIRTWNISFETIHPEGDLIIDERHRFLSSPKGVTVEIIEEFLRAREDIQKSIRKAYRKNYIELVKKLKIQERAIKTCIEGLYGLYGAKGNPEKFIKAFRLFNPDIAEAIPIPARKLVKKTIELCEELNYTVIYGDTDSLFVQLNSRNKKESIEEVHKLVNYLQEQLSKYMDDEWNLKRSEVKLDIDKIFSRFIQFPVKKRYGGYYFYEKGEVLPEELEEFKGIEIVRADTARVSEAMLTNLVRMILKYVDKEIIKRYLTGLYNDVLSGKYSWLDLGIPTRMTKLEYKGRPIQKRASDYSNRYLGTNIQPGQRFYIIYIKQVTGQYPDTDVIAYRKDTPIPDNFKIDYEIMAYNLIVKKCKELLNLINIDVKEIFPVERPKKRKIRKEVRLDSYF